MLYQYSFYGIQQLALVLPNQVVVGRLRLSHFVWWCSSSAVVVDILALAVSTLVVLALVVGTLAALALAASTSVGHPLVVASSSAVLLSDLALVGHIVVTFLFFMINYL